MLSNSDKLVIVEQKIKNLAYQKYGIELDLQLENAAATPDEENLASINSRLADTNAKLDVLNTEKASLEE
jgi:hypothetical protein